MRPRTTRSRTISPFAAIVATLAALAAIVAIGLAAKPPGVASCLR